MFKMKKTVRFDDNIRIIEFEKDSKIISRKNGLKSLFSSFLKFLNLTDFIFIFQEHVPVKVKNKKRFFF